ncbi:MAG: methylenetetrahydrofolate reductase [NAD(P)H] [Planctomycetota bacterium]
MKIPELFKQGRPVFSFEFFPPKTEKAEQQLFETIARLSELKPSFVSVTYGAGGSTQKKTIELVTRIKRETGIEAMAHLTCVGASREEIHGVLDRLLDNGIENVLALRGDPPKGEASFARPAGGFAYAHELVRFIRGSYPSFALGGAFYPEGHIECPDREQDLLHLKQKIDAGLDFVVSQLFFDNVHYLRIVRRVRALGTSIPMTPGIMPITNVEQVERFTSMCGATIPADLMQRLSAVRDDLDRVTEIGVEHATRQCLELLAAGAPGIHFYTLNKSPATRAIFERLIAAGVAC